MVKGLKVELRELCEVVTEGLREELMISMLGLIVGL